MTCLPLAGTMSYLTPRLPPPQDARARSWMKSQAEAMELDFSDDDENAWDNDDGEAGSNVKRGKGGRPVPVEDKKVSQMRESLARLLDSAVLPVGVSPRFVTAHAVQGLLPEMLSHGSTGGSSYKYAGGERVHRKKPHNPRKFGKR